jgi:hypothetical protein
MLKIVFIPTPSPILLGLKILQTGYMPVLPCMTGIYLSNTTNTWTISIHYGRDPHWSIGYLLDNGFATWRASNVNRLYAAIFSFLNLPIGETICSILILWISLASKTKSKLIHNPARINVWKYFHCSVWKRIASCKRRFASWWRA